MNNRDGGLTIDLHDDEHDSGGQVDASVYTLAAVFGPVAFPSNMPNFLKAAILDRAERERDAAGDFVIDSRMNVDDPRRRQAKAEADSDDNLSRLAQMVRNEQEEREREEWAHTRSTVAGVTMTGAEWAQFAERLRNDEDLHRRLINAFEARGMTSDEAETRYKRVADVAEIASIPEGQRTEEQAAMFEKAKADPRLTDDLKLAASLNQAVLTPAPALTAAGLDEGPSSSRITDKPVQLVAGPGF